MKVRVCAYALCAIGLLGSTRGAVAADSLRSDSSVARSEGARAAFDSGSFAAAAGFVEAIPVADRQPRDWLCLARARARLGQLVEALDAYEHLGEITGEQPAQRAARVEAPALAARIPWARIELTSAAPLGAGLIIDQRELSLERLRSPYPVNPGWHVLLVEHEGRVLASRRVHFEEGQERHVLLRLDARSPLAPPASGAPALGAASPPIPTGDASQDGGNPLRTASYVSFAAGIVGLGAGVGFALQALDKDAEMDAVTGCGDLNPCYVSGSRAPQIRQLRDERNSWATASNAAFWTGAAGLIAGTVLYLVSADDEPTESATPLAFTPLIGLDSLGVAGSF